MSEFRLLGDLQLLVADRPVDLGPRKQRTVLAALLLDAGRPVPADTLVDRVWGEAPPAEARNVLYTYITRVRRIIAAASPATDAPAVALTRRPGGYLLDGVAGRVDLHRLRDLADRARRAQPGDPQRLTLLREAVDLWRGEPLAGLPGEWAARIREGLTRQLLGVLADWAAAELDAGNPARVTDRLSRALDQYPLAEPLIAHLMRALHADGRRSEALEQYARSRRRISDELGVEPGAELRALHAEFLRETGPSVPQPRAPEQAENPGALGCQLPADLPDLTGFEPEIAQATTALADGSTPVVVLSGPGGVGKTSLSVHLAHQLRKSYPDGQVFVSLGGRDGSGETLGWVLRALGVAGPQQPTSDAERLARYRQEISTRRVLIVLDDAAGAGEIRPLVPATPGSALIVTSRARLTTIPGAEQIELGVFSRDESMTLLRRIVGAARVDAEPGAIFTLAAICGDLPLALRIVGARLAARPHWTMARMTERMADERRRLDEMTADGLAVRVSVAVGYRALDDAAKRMFRLLGHLGSPDFAEWLAAAVADTSVGAAEDLLEQLVDARLVDVVEDPVLGLFRYRMHDLVRLFAQERADAEETEPQLRDAATRGLSAAIALVERQAVQLPFAVPRLYRLRPPPMPVDPSIVDGAGGPGWLDAESRTLVAAVERAAALGMDDVASVLADGLVFASFGLRNDFEGWNRAHAAALGAARKAGNRDAEAVIECGIGFLRYKEDRFAEAEEHFSAAVALFGEAGNDHGTAAARSGLGTVLREVGHHRRAIPLLTLALEAFTRFGDTDGAAHACYGLGFAHRELGNDDAAVAQLERAAGLYRSLGHWRGEAIAIRGIGLVHRARGELDAAATYGETAHAMVRRQDDPLLNCYTTQSLAKLWIRRSDPDRAAAPLAHARRVCLERNDRFGAALVRRTLGEMHLAAGRLDEARRELERALREWRALDHDLNRARTLRDLGAVHARAGNCDAAHAAWRNALPVFALFGTREAGEMDEWRARWGCDCAPATVAGSAPLRT
ncbi:AfsR/SARP family transcriptional regulator [Virgisporangium aliadipatigenens]|uniref:AfsR/SARP family transcriptional regulator n=1 Tax=Virgisporangium aliadipatigenens TaxID=741659 RepID=UPI00194593AF|nr:BTAD domain-containing putative transcriptional regulator [Virgisporangium aliadipatigenens]